MTKKAITGEMVVNSVTARRWPTATVNCPAGMKLTGGGGKCIDMGKLGWVFMKFNAPLNDHAWTVNCDSSKEQQVKAEAYAFCSQMTEDVGSVWA